MTGLLMTRFAVLRNFLPTAELEFVGGKALCFTGTTSTGNVSLTDISGGLASQPAINDYVVVLYAIRTQNRTPTLTITGNNNGSYDVLAGPVVGDATFDTRLYAFGKYMSGTADTEITYSATGNTADHGTITIHTWRGVNSTTPMDVTPTTAGGTPARPNPPAITPVTDGAVILALGAGVANATWTASYLSNFIQSVDAALFVGSGIGSVAWPGGTYDPAAWTDGWGSATYAAATLALRPA